MRHFFVKFLKLDYVETCILLSLHLCEEIMSDVL